MLGAENSPHHLASPRSCIATAPRTLANDCVSAMDLDAFRVAHARRWCGSAPSPSNYREYASLEAARQLCRPSSGADSHRHFLADARICRTTPFHRIAGDEQDGRITGLKIDILAQYGRIQSVRTLTCFRQFGGSMANRVLNDSRTSISNCAASIPTHTPGWMLPRRSGVRKRVPDEAGCIRCWRSTRRT